MRSRRRAASSKRSSPAAASIWPRRSAASASVLPSSSWIAPFSCFSYSARSTGSTHGARQRLIWYSRHGRERLRNTASEHVRSGNTLRATSSVSRMPDADA